MSGPGVRRARRRRWVLPAALVIAAGCALGIRAVALAGSGPDGATGSRTPSGASSSGASSAEPTGSPTPDPARLTVRRGPLCAALQPADARAALGAPVARRSSYAPGQRVLLAPGLRDVSHEYGCAFRSRSGAQARVWVFAEPVTRRRASALVRSAAGVTGCRPATIAEGFGAPAAGTLCPRPHRPGRDLAARGLFGDAYLTCELLTTGSESAGQAVRRADGWCAGVAGALASGG
jgi:hypothetical protein